VQEQQGGGLCARGGSRARMSTNRGGQQAHAGGDHGGTHAGIVETSMKTRAAEKMRACRGRALGGVIGWIRRLPGATCLDRAGLGEGVGAGTHACAVDEGSDADSGRAGRGEKASCWCFAEAKPNKGALGRSLGLGGGAVESEKSRRCLQRRRRSA
jgi:hypothetical protein